MAKKLDPATLIDAHLKTVGLLVTNSALSDIVLFNTFRILSGCNSKIANAIYFSSETLPQKKKFIRRILETKNDLAEKEIVERIIDAVEKTQTQRNELSHAVLQIKNQRLLRVNSRSNKQDGSKSITAPYLDSLWKQASQSYVEAHQAYQELCLKRGIPPTIVNE